MTLVQKLLGNLHSGFNRDAGAVPALYLTTTDAELSLLSSDNRLIVQHAELQLDALDISDNAVTIQAVADWLLDYFEVAPADSSWALRPARVLLPTVAVAQEDNNKTFTLSARTSLLGHILDAYALELERAKSAIDAMLEQMRLDWAEANWLDEWGGWYGLPRQGGEDDDNYRERIIATLFKLKCNNVALELALSRDYGLYTTVYDAPQPGVFNASMPFDWLAGLLPSAQIAKATRFINQFKAAGTKLGAVQLDAAHVADTVDSSGWGDFAVLGIGVVNRYDGTYKADGTIHYQPSYNEEVLHD